MPEIKAEHVVIGAIAVAVGYLKWNEVTKPVEALPTTPAKKYYVMTYRGYDYIVTTNPEYWEAKGYTVVGEHTDVYSAHAEAEALRSQIVYTPPIERKDWMLVKTDSLYACVLPTTTLIYTQVIRSNLSYDECVQLATQYANVSPAPSTTSTTTYPQPYSSTQQPSPTTPKPNSPECCKSQLDYKSPWTGAIVKCILDGSGSPCGYTCYDVDGSRFGLATGCNV
jgi:hypothetical protein